MNYNEFLDAVLEALSDYFQERATVTIHSVVKNNGMELDGLVIMEKGRNVSPTIYLNDYYEMHKRQMNIGEITQKILKVYEEHVNQGMDFSYISDFEKVREKIVFRVINTALNKDLLKNIPHKEFLDLTVCYAVLIQGENFGNGMILIHNQHMDMWGVDALTIETEAIKNTPMLLKPVWCTMESMLQRLMFDEAPQIEFDEEILYVLTNSEKYYGASCMLYDGLLMEIAEKIDSDFYVIPSSVNELILIKKEFGLGKDYIAKMVREINDEVVCKEEILSYVVYEFDRKSGILHM